MIKLLIADDEPLVLVGMQSMLDWASLNIEICATAHNGKQALALIEEHQPEIVITDIKMPLMSGLELAAACHEAGEELPVFIILTSFEEFELAREAMRSGAMEYLIKLELTPQSLRAAIEKAAARVEKLKGSTAATPRSEGQAFREKFFARLYNGLFDSPEQFRRQAEELGLSFSAPAYAAAACEIHGVREAPAEQQLTQCASTVRMAREALEKFGPCFVTPLDMRQFCVIFPLTGQQAADADYLPRMLRTCADTVRGYFNVRLRCGIGGAVRNAFALPSSARAARCALTLTDDTQPVACAQSDAARDPAALGPGKRRVVEDVTAYIRQHLDRRLSLNEVAEAFSFSPNYLSQLFAKYADRGFVETITHEKIAAARRLLAGGDVRIYEVAEQLGYESAFYFSKVFKKETGQSPREYMQGLPAK